MQHLQAVILPSIFCALQINTKFTKTKHMDEVQCLTLIGKCRQASTAMAEAFIANYEGSVYQSEGPCPRFHIFGTNITESFAATFAATVVFNRGRFEIPPKVYAFYPSIYNKELDQLRADCNLMGGSRFTTTSVLIQNALSRELPQFNKKQTVYHHAPELICLDLPEDFGRGIIVSNLEDIHFSLGNTPSKNDPTVLDGIHAQEFSVVVLKRLSYLHTYYTYIHTYKHTIHTIYTYEHINIIQI